MFQLYLKQISVLVAGIVLSASLSGCGLGALVTPLPAEAPKAPPTPNWKSEKGFIKAVGMLPSAQAKAHAYWTKDNRLYVMGNTIGADKWEDYYKIKAFKANPELLLSREWEKIENQKYSVAYLPVWDPKTGNISPVRGYSHYTDAGVQLPDGRIYFRSYIDVEPFVANAPLNQKRDDHKKILLLEVIDPVVGKAQLLPPFRILYNDGIKTFPSGNLLLNGWVYPWWNYKWTHDRKSLTSHYMVLDPVNRRYLTELNIYPGHNGTHVIMPDSEHLLNVGGDCFTEDKEKEIFSLDGDLSDLQKKTSPCYRIDYINIKNKTTETVGALPSNLNLQAGAWYEIGQLFPIDNDRILLVGGIFEPNHTETNQVAVFNIKTHQFKVLGELKFQMGNQTFTDTVENIVHLSDNSVVILGTGLYLFEQKTEKLIFVDQVIDAQESYGAAISQDDKIYIAGGFGGREPRLIQMFDYRAYKKNVLKH